MDITQVRRLLQGRCTKRSQWEFTHFVMEAYGDYTPRAVQSVLARLREIDDQLMATPYNNDTLRCELEAEAQQLHGWVSQFSEEELATQLDRLEEFEEAYWVERLAREAVVDMLSTGKVSRETMSRAILLKEENYRKFVEISATLGQYVDGLTREIEQAHNPNLPENMPR